MKIQPSKVSRLQKDASVFVLTPLRLQSQFQFRFRLPFRFGFTTSSNNTAARNPHWSMQC